MNKQRIVIAVCTFVLIAFAARAEAGWGRYRVTTYYGTPSVPVPLETVVVGRPVVVAMAPVTAYYSAPVTTYYSAPVTTYYSAPVTTYYSAPVTTYYSAPVTAYYGPRGVVRAAYYAPAPRVYYYAPATVILP